MGRADMAWRLQPEQLAGLLLVLSLHAAALWGLWQYRTIPAPAESMTLFVNFIAPPAPERKEEPKRPPPKPKPIEKPQPRQIVAETPVVAPTDYVAPPLPPIPLPTPTPEPAIKESPMPLPTGPVALSSELAVSCPERTPPAYPAQARRFGEQGKVLLQVNLDEEGRVSAAHVVSGSGYARLDAAALAAIKTWRCQPARHNGEPVRAVALQPFDFKLEGY